MKLTVECSENPKYRFSYPYPSVLIPKGEEIEWINLRLITLIIQTFLSD